MELFSIIFLDLIPAAYVTTFFFLLLSSSSLYGYTIICLYSHRLLNMWAAINSAAMNMDIHTCTFMWMYVFISPSETAGSC